MSTKLTEKQVIITTEQLHTGSSDINNVKVLHNMIRQSIRAKLSKIRVSEICQTLLI